ncbi:unnamed protein product [Rotaria sordida]|uniref:Uncharacterized protein n=2 Tax=Rotaria sordida TaxID=392033 RepID=A0A819MFV2_9BILA|nr:unnamed protein product [Rotaria sordida]
MQPSYRFDALLLQIDHFYKWVKNGTTGSKGLNLIKDERTRRRHSAQSHLQSIPRSAISPTVLIIIPTKNE